MLSKKITKALNDQLDHEMYSSYLYLAMSAHFEYTNLRGFAHWTRVQYEEELIHFNKFFDYINEKGGQVALGAIEAPPIKWKSPLDAAKAILSHEQMITGKINDLVELAIKEKDYATNAMLQWFVTEQVEEEASADEVLQNIKLVKDAPGGLYMLDRELSQRPTPGASAGETA